MKKLIVMAMLGLTTAWAEAQTASTNELTGAELNARRKESYERFLKKTGGHIVKPGTGKLVFVNLQKKIPASDLQIAAAELERLVQIKIEVVPSDLKISIGNAETSMKSLGANAAVYFVEDPSLPLCLVAPEGSWAIVNGARLTKDSPDAGRLSKRAQAMAWRAFCYVAGGAECGLQNCCLNPARDAKELDALPGPRFCQHPLQSFGPHLAHAGITPFIRTTYRAAVRQGWAPAPTNDYQKAIWEQVNADKERGPTNPIRIAPKQK